MGLVILIVAYVVLAIPAYILAQRRNLEQPWVAFVPFFGATIVMLWSIDRSGWLSLLGVVPLVNIIFSIWLLVTMPAEHGRTRWWALALLVPLVGLLWYALTLPDRSEASIQPA